MNEKYSKPLEWINIYIYEYFEKFCFAFIHIFSERHSTRLGAEECGEPSLENQPYRHTGCTGVNKYYTRTAVACVPEGCERDE